MTHKVASEDSARLSIAQDIVYKSTGFFRRIIALASGVTSSYRTVIVFRLRIASGGSLQGMAGSSVAGGAQHAAANKIGERTTGYCRCRIVLILVTQKSFEGMLRRKDCVTI